MNKKKNCAISDCCECENVENCILAKTKKEIRNKVITEIMENMQKAITCDIASNGGSCALTKEREAGCFGCPKYTISFEEFLYECTLLMDNDE